MRWLFHIRPESEPSVEAYAPESLAREGFIHASFRDDVPESARLYFSPSARIEVLQIDPRRLDARVELAATPRGTMPHIHGPIPRDAIRQTRPIDGFAASDAPDVCRGTRFAFVAFEDMTLLDLVGVYDPLSRIRSMGFDGSSSSEIVASEGARVWARDGAELSAIRVRPSLVDFDVVVVPGGPGSRAFAKNAELLAWLRTFPENRLLASVCTGALILGALGRLRGKPATTHASALGDLAAYGATAVRERVVDAGQVVTAGGVTSGIHLGLYLVGRLEGDDVRAKIAAQMEWE